MGKPSPPPAPDYAAAARAQGTENIAAARTQARLNTPNTYTPYGSQTVSFGSPTVNQAGYDQAMQDFNNRQEEYDSSGNVIAGTAPTIEQFTTAGDSDTPTIRQTLNPESQRALEAQQRIGRGLSETAEQYALPTLQNALQNRFDPSGYDIQTSLGPQMPVNYGPAMGQYGMAGSVPSGAFGQAGSVGAGQYGMAQGIDAGAYGQAQGVNAGQFGGLKTGADMSGVAAMPVNAGMTGQQAIMARLQPQLAQQSAATAQQLANQGITPGSEAYNNAMRQQQQSQNDLLSQAALQGIGLDMSANQQGYGQAMGQAGMYNAALGQGFGQAAQAQQMGNQAIGQNFGQGVTAQQLANQAIGQNYGQGMSSQQLANQAIGQNYGQAMSSQDQANAAMGQNYGQAGTSAGLYNQAAAQQYNQNLGAAQFGNQAQQQRLQQNLAMRNQPLNEIMGLLSGSQIQTPQFQAYQGGGNIQAAPVAQAATNQGNYDTAAYNARMQALGGLYGGIGSIAGSVLGGGLGAGGFLNR
jgi:hypothetical protein